MPLDAMWGQRLAPSMHGMRPFGALVSKEEALAMLLDAARPVTEVEELPLAAARARAAAEEVRAPFAVPPFDRATMDGYAVRAQDAAAPGARLRVVGEALAGARSPPPVGVREAARVATGAPVPPGADSVVRVEDTFEEDGSVMLRVAVRARQNVDPAGADLPLDALVVAPGVALTPARLGLLASVGRARVRVLRRPRVALFSSGDELLRPGEALRPGAIYDSNGTTLRALLEDAGAEVDAQPALPDDLAALRGALRAAAASHDLVLFTGGASVGAKDLTVDALRAEGRVLFHGVRVKPGKPLLAGSVGRALVVGLPGNPTSALTNAALFVVPALRRLAGLPEAWPRLGEATLAVDVKGEPERFLFLPVRWDEGRAVPTFKGSGALTSLAASDGWIGVPEGASLAAGARVVVHAW